MSGRRRDWEKRWGTFGAVVGKRLVHLVTGVPLPSDTLYRNSPSVCLLLMRTGAVIKARESQEPIPSVCPVASRLQISASSNLSLACWLVSGIKWRLFYLLRVLL